MSDEHRRLLALHGRIFNIEDYRCDADDCVVVLKAAAALEALQSRLKEAEEACAEALHWIERGEFDDGSEQSCPVEAIVPRHVLDMLRASAAAAKDAEGMGQ